MSKKYNGLTGLYNLGNTCYMNSCLQILLHTYELDECFKKISLQDLKKIVDTDILIAWDNVHTNLWHKNTIFTPLHFVNVLHKVSNKKQNIHFSSFNQNDISEFLLFLMECFHNSISRKVIMNISGTVINKNDDLAKECFNMISNFYTNDYSEIIYLFYAVQVSRIVSLDGKEILSNKPEPFFILNLPIPNIKEPTLYDCFDLYTEYEVLEGENSWLNEKTNKKETVLKELMFWSLPEILVIDIKRFNASNHKNKVLVTFPLDELNLSEYVIGYNNHSYKYKLYAVCNHYGDVLGGHYDCCIKVFNEKWYKFNDQDITEIDNDAKIVTPYVYCLFYRKI
jgi:ubiquitin C-terminal hydrolase